MCWHLAQFESKGTDPTRLNFLKVWCISNFRHVGIEYMYQGADKSLARPGRKQARKHVKNACDFNNIETRAVISFFFQGAKRNSRHLAETLACFLPGHAKDLSASIIYCIYKEVQFKSELQHAGTWSAPAWPPCRLCYRPAVFFRHVHLIALSFRPRHIRSALENILLFSFS